ncbi:UNVERIFIED_CONTAM: hypothetical protein RMT77_003070 [Armadillidium vulgare]
MEIKMTKNIYLFIIVIEVLFALTKSQNPEDTCTVQGQAICLNCQTVALCDEDENNPGTFTTRNSTNSQCSPDHGYFCDDTTVFGSGTCARYNPTYTNCDCDGTTNCQKDPNNGNVYIPCEGENLDVTGTAFYCESDRIQLDTCTCFEGTLGAKISELRINSGKLATPERDPVDTCTAQAQSICLNCQTVALCEEDEDNPGTFTTRNSTQSSCSPIDGLYCDDTTVFPSGTCARYNPTYTNCDCDGTTNCQKDPNNGNVYIPCEGENLDVTGTAFYCESDRIQLDTCTCVESTLGAKISELRINSGKLATPEKDISEFRNFS